MRRQKGFCSTFRSERQGETVKTAKRHLAKLLSLIAPALLALAAAMEVYVVLYPTVTAPYGIGAGIFAIGVVGWLLWLATRTAAYLLGAEEDG